MNNKRTDTNTNKRIELHAHTNMSQLSAVADTTELIKRAIDWGHEAIAVTDQYGVHSFPAAFRAAEGKIKIIYGMEGYMIEDADCDISAGTNIMILAKNKIGLKNLYYLVSESYLQHYQTESIVGTDMRYYDKDRPMITREMLDQYREGLLIGTSPCKGEVFTAVMAKANEDAIEKMVSFYDYIEIHPNNNPFAYDKDDIEAANRRIVEIGKRNNIPVVATGNVHYLDPKDRMAQRVLMYAFEGETCNMPGTKRFLREDELLEEFGSGYFMTTEEMLSEMSYLEDACEDVVISNPKKIANSIENIDIFPEDILIPTVDSAIEELVSCCNDKAIALYGQELPEPINSRLQTEISSIRENNYASIYIITKQLVDKAKDSGQNIGFRGASGSSLVCWLLGITDINPLPAHYYCPNCKRVEWLEESNVYCGFDYPNKICSKCGKNMMRDGFNIPSELFYGIDGKKQPDINLNFAVEYVSVAAQQLIDTFGKNKVVRAGTVVTIGPRAYKYVCDYVDFFLPDVTQEDISNLIKKNASVKRTTGMHPGGMFVVPERYDILDFTPVQHPGNGVNSDIVTTHFEYHDMDEKLLKVDVLQHYDFSMLNRLEKMTGVEVESIDLCDKKVFEIFQRINVFGIVDAPKIFLFGTCGLTGFESEHFVDMLSKLQPESIGELIKVSALAHSVDAWLGNQDKLVEEGEIRMDEIIATREDVLDYLLKKGFNRDEAYGLSKKIAFGIFDKGKDEELVEQLREYDVPERYINVFTEIKYLFPKGHVAIYTITAFRLAYYKLYHPLEFYAAYYNTYMSDFDWDIIKRGKDVVLKKITERSAGLAANFINKRKRSALKTVYEMLSRGYEFKPLERGNTIEFEVRDGKIGVPICAQILENNAINN